MNEGSVSQATSNETAKVPVTERALIQRINRKLAKQDEMLRKTRPVFDGDRPVYDHNVGEFYTVDTSRNFIASTHVNLEEFGATRVESCGCSPAGSKRSSTTSSRRTSTTARSATRYVSY